MLTSDTTTFELGNSRLKLKEGLRFSLQQNRKQTWYLIHDESSETFFRIGISEYTFLSMLDGKTTLANALAGTCSTVGVKAFNEHDAIQLCQWLIESGLAQTRESTRADRLQEKTSKVEKAKNIQRLNPISVRFPLCNLDKTAEFASRYLGRFVSSTFAIIWIMTVGWAAFSLWSAPQSLGQINFFSRDNVLWMILTWLVLKTIHELAHIVSCKKFGGRVGQGGILLLLLIPMPYVDVTSAWAFTSRFRRIVVSAAGMLAEIFLAAIAAIVWSNSGPGFVQYQAFNVMIAASVHTLLFNANPLMRFDGYHMLADTLGIPNLGNHGQQYIQSKINWLFYGKQPPAIKYGGFSGQMIRLYGIGALLWKVFLFAVLAIAGANLFEGFGLVIALMAGGLWVGVPLYKLIKYLIFGSETDQPDRFRFLLVTSTLLVCMYAAAAWVPAPSVISAPMVVVFDDKDEVRALAGGFIASVEVAPLQAVTKGQILARMENKDLESRKQKLEVELEKAKLQASYYQKEENIAALQTELNNIRSIKKRLKEVTRDFDSLVIRAAINGIVSELEIENLIGRYVRPGTQLMTVSCDESKIAVAMFSQHDAPSLSNIVGKTVQIRTDGDGFIGSAQIKNLSPSATNSLPHFALAGKYGGTLGVVDRGQVESNEDNQDNLMLIHPCLEAELELLPQSRKSLREGQTGLIHLRERDASLGQYVSKKVVNWMFLQLTRNHGI